MITSPQAVADHLGRLGLAVSGSQAQSLFAEAEFLGGAVSQLRVHARPAGWESFGEMMARLRPKPPHGLISTASEVDRQWAARAHEQARSQNPALNCFVKIFDRVPSVTAPGPLAGVPFAFKDAFMTPYRSPGVGVPATRVPQRLGMSRTVSALEAAGAVAIGALNLDPDCFSTTGLNPFFGRVRNPRNPAYAVGGSSSGAAAAVAAGIVPFSLGTDTGGSIRIPASLCGVLGLRPTQSLLEDEGVAALSSSQDTVGVVAADLEMVGRAMEVLAPGSAPRSGEAAMSGVRIGVNRSELLAELHPEVEQPLTAVLASLGARGHALVEVPFPPLRDLNTLASLLTCRESFTVHAGTLAAQPETYSTLVQRRLLLAASVEAEDYAFALGQRAGLLDLVLRTTFAEADVLICPTIRTIAPRVDGIRDDDIEATGPMNAEFLRLNRPFSFLGLPALAVPIGVDRNGMPVGCQLIGRPFSEPVLLDFAERVVCVGAPAVQSPGRSPAH